VVRTLFQDSASRSTRSLTGGPGRRARRAPLTTGREAELTLERVLVGEHPASQPLPRLEVAAEHTPDPPPVPREPHGGGSAGLAQSDRQLGPDAVAARRTEARHTCGRDAPHAGSAAGALHGLDGRVTTRVRGRGPGGRGAKAGRTDRRPRRGRR
jgi:hypothetical protein